MAGWDSVISEPVLGGNSDRRSRSTVVQSQGIDSIRNNKDRRGLQGEVLARLMVTTMIDQDRPESS